ncbi:unnamed protein product [Caenorhabditis brenneri]
MESVHNEYAMPLAGTARNLTQGTTISGRNDGNDTRKLPEFLTDQSDARRTVERLRYSHACCLECPWKWITAQFHANFTSENRLSS